MHLLFANYCFVPVYYGCTDIFPPFRTATKVSEMLGNVNTSSALSAFEKMEEKGSIPLAIIITYLTCLHCGCAGPVPVETRDMLCVKCRLKLQEVK